MSTVVYGEQVHSKIRRFVVVRKADRSCVCLPITVVNSKSHSRKLQSMNLAEYGVVFSTTLPGHLDGITLRPVRVQAAKGNGPFRDYSLVDYARPCTIETNVKVKEVGILDSDSRVVLMANFKQVFVSFMESEVATPTTPKSKFAEIAVPMQLSSIHKPESVMEPNLNSDRQVADVHQTQQEQNAEYHRSAREHSFPLLQEGKLDSSKLTQDFPSLSYGILAD